MRAAAQDAASAKNFVASLYRFYGKNGRGVPFIGPAARKYYHSSLLALILADEKAVGPGRTGVLDADLVCGCQDWEGIWNLQMEIQNEVPNRAQARVSFALSLQPREEKRELLITLVPEHGQWRIWNIRDDSDPKQPFDVRQALEAEIRRLSKRKPTR